MSTSPSFESSPRVILWAKTAADLMTPNPVSLNAASSVTEAAAILADKGVSAAAVIDEAGRPVGVLSQSDIVAHSYASVPLRAVKPEYYEKGMLSPQPKINQTDVVDGSPIQVNDIMTPLVFSVALETPAHKVIEDMLARNVHRLFVVGTGGVLVGVISTIDVLKHLCREEPVTSTEVSSASTTGSRTLG